MQGFSINRLGVLFQFGFLLSNKGVEKLLQKLPVSAIVNTMKNIKKNSILNNSNQGLKHFLKKYTVNRRYSVTRYNVTPAIRHSYGL